MKEVCDSVDLEIQSDRMSTKVIRSFMAKKQKSTPKAQQQLKANG